jgi:hypothetical protein
MKSLIFFLLINVSAFSQTCKSDVTYSVDNNLANIEWSNLNADAVVITFPNNQKIMILTLDETQLNMEVPLAGRYTIEFINNEKTINTLIIEI